MSQGSATTTQSASTAPNPYVVGPLQNAISGAVSQAATPYSTATQTNVAGLNSAQTNAFGQLQNAYGSAQPYINQAQGYINSSADPNTVANNISTFSSPYTQQVINSTLALKNQQDQMQQQQLQSNAAAQGALGGDRSAIANAVLRAQQGLGSAQLAAGLNQQNYTQALGASQNNANMQAQAGYGLANLGQEALNTGITGAQAGLSAGNAQQQQQQNVNNAATQNALQQQQFGYQNQNFLASQLGALSPLLGGTSSGQTTAPAPNMFGTYAGSALAGLSLLADGGRVKRAEGGSVNGMMSEPYELSPLPVAHANFPSLPQLPQQNNQNNTLNQVQQMQGFANLGKNAAKNSGGFSRLNNSLGDSTFGSTPAVSDGGWQTSITPSGGFLSGIGSSLGFANGGSVRHFDDGGAVFDDNELPSDPTIVQPEYYDPSGQRFNSFSQGNATPVSANDSTLMPMVDQNSTNVAQRFAQNKNVDPNAAASITGQLESGQSNPLKGVSNISKDSNGSESFGNFGLNTQKGASAWQFRDSYGKPLGIIADPGTPQFHEQWNAAVAKDAASVRNAELAWHSNNILPIISPSLQKIGIPEAVAKDPRVVAYIADRAIQQGPGSIDDLTGRTNGKHASRISDAYSNSNGDTVSFLKNLSQADFNAYENDFPSAIKSGVYPVEGHANRIANREKASLGIGRPHVDNDNDPIGSLINRVMPSSGSQTKTSGIGDLINRLGIGGNQQSQTATTPAEQTQNKGFLNSLGLGDLNPLSLNDTQRNALLTAGLGMIGNPSPFASVQVGQGGLQGMNTYLSEQDKERAAAAKARELAQTAQYHQQEVENTAKQRAETMRHNLFEESKPIVNGETQFTDSFGIPHLTKQYTAPIWNPQTKSYVYPQNNQSSPKQNTPEISNLPSDVTGDEFVRRAKDTGYSPFILDQAKNVADYKYDPNKLFALKDTQRANIISLASRINPDYDMAKYPAIASTEKMLQSGDVAKSLRSIGRLFDEVEQTSNLAGKTGNSRSQNFNSLTSHLYPSGSEYGKTMASLGTALNNVSDTASAVAKGGGQGAEGDARRRRENMNEFQAPDTLKAALFTEAEIALKNGQSNLSSYNNAHGYTADNPKYKTIFDYMTPAQQKRAVQILGPDKIEEVTGKPVSPEIRDHNLQQNGGIENPQAMDFTKVARPSGKSDEQLKTEAQAAIKSGKDPKSVIAQLQAWGIQ